MQVSEHEAESRFPERPATFSPILVLGQKRHLILPLRMPVSGHFGMSVYPGRSRSFSARNDIILRGCRRGEPRQGVAVVPGDPLRRMLLQFRDVPQQFGEIGERISAVELALSKVYAGAPGAWPLWVTVTRKPRASRPFTHFSMRRRIVSGVS